MEQILNELNPSQRDAVEHIDGAMLILAGAGSGKTKTLTARLAYLVGEVGIDPANTLTLTFTNKAAAEMRERALKLMPTKVSYPPLFTGGAGSGESEIRRYILENDYLETIVAMPNDMFFNTVIQSMSYSS